MRIAVFFFCFFSFALKAHNNDSYIIVVQSYPDSSVTVNLSLLQKNSDEDKKAVATFLAFPLPLGILGAHRIYMGAKPYIPLIYILTLGGCFGILPLIDFIVIVTHKNIEPYQNDKVFMWLK